jgi:hypothetical protein
LDKIERLNKVKTVVECNERAVKPKEGRHLREGRREGTRKNKTRKEQDTRECIRSIGKERMSGGWEWRTNGQK